MRIMTAPRLSPFAPGARSVTALNSTVYPSSGGDGIGTGQYWNF